MPDDQNTLARRRFLTGLASAAGAVPIVSGLVVSTEPLARARSTPASAEADDAGTAATGQYLVGGYQSLGPEEIDFVEALVNVMCPADHLTPNGVDCGLATFIDRQLAGAFGSGARLYQRGPWKQGTPQQGYQLPQTPERYFKLGLAAADAAAVAKFGKRFSELSPTDAEAFLQGISDAQIQDDEISLASWFNELVYPLFVQACYADPIYSGNKDKIFWRMIGYPGLPATHTRDMVKFRGKAYPGAKNPKSILDFS